jgi:hypothetical protein
MTTICKNISEKYREMVDKTCLLKDTEEKENKVQKRRHEEAKQERKNKGPKHIARWKLITRRGRAECISMCHICKRSSKHGNKLCCDDCQTFYHKVWVTRYHMVHIPDSEDSDTLVCHICYKQNIQNSTDEIPLHADNGSDTDIYIYLLIAIGLTAGGSSTVHIYTQIIRRTTQLIWKECRPCPIFGKLYPGICLTTEEKAQKNLSHMGAVHAWNSELNLQIHVQIHCLHLLVCHNSVYDRIVTVHWPHNTASHTLA